MEDTLRDQMFANIVKNQYSLNPCFNGRYSQSSISATYDCYNLKVLILVLMEDTLREK